jgi:hypothetical protein
MKRTNACSPKSIISGGGSGTAGTCYTREQLLKIAQAYNSQHSVSEHIQLTGSKEQLWRAIDSKMQNTCKASDEYCWLEKLRISRDDMRDAFRPSGPAGQYEWLSTSQIRDVLVQYEKIYPDFVMLGPVPIDFCALTGNEVCNLNIRRSIAGGKRRIGIVFNTDPSTAPGRHWISMFIDMTDKNPTRWQIDYFDSFGQAPLPAEIRSLIENLQAQNQGHFRLNLNCKLVPGGICTVSRRHQYKNTECGVYSINFIVERLSGKSWEDIVIREPKDDTTINNLRKSYFR